MSKEKEDHVDFKIRNVKVEDIKEVYKLLVDNQPYVGLNSRYTYFLLARDFSDTCVVAEHDGKIVGFSSGYISQSRMDTFFNWETVVRKDYRGNNLQKQMLLHQIRNANVKYFEGTVNPSNQVSEKNFVELAESLNAKFQKRVLFSEEDFENDGHEAEILCRVGPISQNKLKTTKNF
jgi:L-2,4-diaminobutyric acid acetyltransferase